MKKLFLLLSSVIVLVAACMFTASAEEVKVATAPGTTVTEGKGAVIDSTNANQGYVMIKKTADSKIKVRIANGDKVIQRYTITDKDKFYPIPLQLGNGNYTISVFTQVEGNSYAKAAETTANVALADADAPFEYNNIFCNYNKDSQSVKKGFELTQDAGADDLEVVKAVYNHVIGTLKYDYDRAATVTDTYIPNPDAVLAESKGICFDYSSLMATMLRAKGIPTKIVFGYTKEGTFHAWNDVYITGQGWVSTGIKANGGWKLLDSTFGALVAPDYMEDTSNYSPAEYY